MDGLAGKRNFEHGSNKSRWNAVAGDVGNKNAKMISFESQEIVKIARDSTHRKIACSDFDPSAARNIARQDGRLNLLRYFKLLLDCKEALLFSENAMGNEIAEGAHEKKKASRFQVAPANQVKSGQIGVDNEKAKDAQAYSHDAEVAR